MTVTDDDRVFKIEKAGSLEGRLRKLIQNPGRLLKDYVKEGMTVLDLGCGPGFFSIEVAKMVGKGGKVIAADLQEGMLEKLRRKIEGTDLEKIIRLHKTRSGSIGIGGSEKVDFVLAFYIMHELPDQEKALSEISSHLRPGGILYIVEPSFRVSKDEFEATLKRTESAGFEIIKRPWMLMSRAAVLRK